MHRTSRWLSFLFGAVLITGCPRRFDPRADEIHTTNADLEADYQAAVRHWKQGDLAGAENRLAALFQKHKLSHTDPVFGLAQVLSAKLARMQGHPEAAAELLRPLAQGTAPVTAEPVSPVRSVARFELGLVEHRLGSFASAERWLSPFAEEIVEGEDATELHAVLADLYRRRGDAGAALRAYGKFYASAQTNPVEQAYIRTQVQALLRQLPSSEQQVVSERFGLKLPGTATTDRPSPQVRVGLAVPLSGKDKGLGERVLRGALFASRQASAAGAQTPERMVQLSIRDTGLLHPTDAIAELVAEGAQVVIGSPVKAQSDALAKAAAAHGVPYLTPGFVGSPPPPGTFRLLVSNEARAQALASQVRSGGFASVAVLAPATSYGQAVTKAFVEGLAGAVEVKASLTFAPNATTFTSQGKQLIELSPHALFIASSSAQLEQIAAQLAVLGVIPTQRVEKRETEPPVRLIAAMAEGANARLFAQAGRYLQGALVAPITSAGLPVLPSTTGFDAYTAETGAEVGALDALGGDAIHLVRKACADAVPATSVECDKQRLQSGLQRVSLEGATGVIQFDAQGVRRSPPLLLRVERDRLSIVH